MLKGTADLPDQSKCSQSTDLRGKTSLLKRCFGTRCAHHCDRVTYARYLAADVDEVTISQRGGVVPPYLYRSGQRKTERMGLRFEAMV